MKIFLKKYLPQIIVGIFITVTAWLITAYANQINKEVDGKASKEMLENAVIKQESNVNLIKKDIKHIEHLLEDQNTDFKERFERVENKLDQLILNK